MVSVVLEWILPVLLLRHLEDEVKKERGATPAGKALGRS